MTHTAPQPDSITVIYDGDCPFCLAFVRMTRLREAAGEVRLLDARGMSGAVRRVLAAGYSLDDGMAVIVDDRICHGDAAMTLLASLTTRSGAFNRVVRLLFRSPRIARLAYPPLRAGRALTLRLIGRKTLGF